MKTLMNEIELPDDLANLYLVNGSEPGVLSDLARLNVFIAENNSGKSRFLRALFNQKEWKFGPSQSDLSKLCNEYVELFEKVGVYERQFPKRIQFGEEFDGPISELNQIRKNVLGQRILNEFDSMIERLRMLVSSLPKEVRTVYIPTLRGLRQVRQNENLYFKRTVEDYFQSDKIEAAKISEARVITGLEFYKAIKSYSHGTLPERHIIEDYEDYLGHHFFRRKVSLIPREGGNVLFIKVGSEHEQPVHKLGDGLQQLLIITFPLFLHRDDDLLLFVEEPEMHLHPGLQRALIECFLKPIGTGTCQVFVATHSNHFLDITLDHQSISVYRFRKEIDDPEDPRKENEPRFMVENASNDDFTLLRELGVRNSSVLLSNCTIWVEGITDRLYLRKVVEILQSEKKPSRDPFLEDLHFSFVEYGGGNITHWSFLDDGGPNVERICGELFLIADNDNAEDEKPDGKKSERFKKLEQQLGARFYRLKCREIENMLAPSVIEGVVRDYENGKVTLKAFSQSDYQSIGLGTFIEQNVFEGESTRKSNSGHPYEAESGTLKDKTGFCKRALQHMCSIDDLSEEAKELGSHILRFIEQHNPQNAALASQ